MDERRRRQLESDISGLESDNNRARGEMRNREAIKAEAPAKDVQGHQNYIDGLKKFIRANEENISKMKRELQQGR